MEPSTPKEFFEKTLPERFKPAKAAGIDVIVQINISGENGGEWATTIKNQALQTQEGTVEKPDLTLIMTEKDFMDLMTGRTSAERAFFAGKIKFKGNIAVALKLRDAGFL